MGKERLLTRYGQPLRPIPLNQAATARLRLPPAPAPAPTAPPIDLNLRSGDAQLTCKGCNASFVWTVEQQTFHKTMGFDNQPCWCSTCKAAKPARAHDSKHLPCLDFAKGKCTRGENCRFGHAPIPVNNLAIANAAHDDPATIHDGIGDDEGFEMYRPDKILYFDSRVKPGP